MTAKSDQLAQIRQAFARRWAPDDEPERNGYRRHDFEIELDRLLYAAFAVAQEPFIRELEMFRDLTLKSAMLSPKPIIP